MMAGSDVKEALAPRGIVHVPERCTGCGICDLMCSLHHEGEQGQALSRGALVGVRMTADYTFNVCYQCSPAACHEACPLKDEALLIDGATGVPYIDPEVCNSCGDCIVACPLDPPRIKLHAAKNVAIKCDLCRGRAEGPTCIEYCNFDALALAPQEAR